VGSRRCLYRIARAIDKEGVQLSASNQLGGMLMAQRKNTKYETSYDASGDKALTWFFVGLGFIALVTALVGQVGGA